MAYKFQSQILPVFVAGGQEVTRSRRDTSTVLAQVADIDYQMYQTLQSMPLAIQEAR